MKRIFLLLLALTLVFSMIACGKSDAADPTSATPTTNPTVDPGSDDHSQPTDPTDPLPDDPEEPEPPVSTQPDEQDLQTATQLTRNYTWYLAVGLCCEFELVGEDMSAWLSDSQKQNYHQQQYRLLCCHTAEEVREHINQTMVKELQVRGYPDEWLFTDDEGALYLIIIPTGYADYRDVTIAKSGDCLYAKTGIFDEDGWFADAYFTIETQNGIPVITQVLRTNHDEIPEEIKNLPYCTPAES